MTRLLCVGPDPKVLLKKPLQTYSTRNGNLIDIKLPAARLRIIAGRSLPSCWPVVRSPRPGKRANCHICLSNPCPSQDEQRVGRPKNGAAQTTKSSVAGPLTRGPTRLHSLSVHVVFCSEASHNPLYSYTRCISQGLAKIFGLWCI